MGDRPHVVEELGVDGPLLVLRPDVLADDLRAQFRDDVAQQELLLAGDAVAQPLVGRAAFVGGLGGGGEPAFIDAAAVRAEGVVIVRMEFEPSPRLQQLRRRLWYRT